MKYALLFILSFLISLQQSNAQKKYVMVVGVADYKNNNMDLRYSDDDAYRFYAYMKSTKGGSVPDENIVILVDEAATRKNILQTMNKVFAKAGRNDMLIFYFSGHGTKGAFCPYETSNDFNSLLSYDDIKKVFKKYPAKYKIVVGDACHSGSIYEGAPKGMLPISDSTNIVLIMSSKYSEVSEENQKIRQGAFSFYFRHFCWLKTRNFSYLNNFF
jgi:uncharacterized caspase-like protein